MHHWFKTAIFLLLVFYPALGNAQLGKHNYLSVKSAATYRAGGKDKGSISCFASKLLIQNNKTVIQSFAFYAMNDVRGIPMELTLKGKPLPVKIAATKDSQSCIFTALLADIFSLKGSSPYQWKWHARARVPASPVADVAGQKVKKVNCWFILQANKKYYSSDTVSISIQ